jgi:hypothetical protein
MRNTLVVTTLTLLATPSHLALAQQPKPPVKLQTKPIEPREGTVGWLYWGVVKDLTKDSITIECWGEKPKTFAASETLAAGKVPKEPRLKPGQVRGYDVSPADMYRLTDVKVGDWVVILYARLGGADICDHIQIILPCLKRPNGWPRSKEGSRPRPVLTCHRQCSPGFARGTGKGFATMSG